MTQFSGSNKYVQRTYPGIIILSDDGTGADTTLRYLYTANGTATALKLSTNAVDVIGTLYVNGVAIPSSIAPADATYIVKTANSTLTGEFALGTLSSGYMKVTTATGDVTSTATIPYADLTGVQASDATLTSIAALGTASDKMLYTTGVDTWAEAAITAAGRSMVAAADAAAQKTLLSLDLVENTALSTWAGTTNVTTLGTIATGTWSATTVAVNKGGTGQTSYTDGQLLIGNTTGNTLAKATLTGTANKITVTNGSGSITLTIPADLDLSANTSVAIPSGAGGTTINAAGRLCADTTSKTLNFYDGAAEKVLQPEIKLGVCDIYNPSSSEKQPMGMINWACTITKIHAVLIGSSTPSVTYKVMKGSDLSAAGTAVVTAGSTVTSTTTGTSVTSFDSATITAGDNLWLTTTAQSGTVNHICVTVYGTITP